jgi:tRNA pseudouridine38-40 synthase
MAIGRGDRRESWAAEVLALRDRALGGITAPPDGLYLVGVEYPPAFGLPDWRLRPVPTWREAGVH